jgi:hypothetical protein
MTEIALLQTHQKIPSSETYSLTSSSINEYKITDKRLNMPKILGGYIVQSLNAMAISCEHGNELHGKRKMIKLPL